MIFIIRYSVAHVSQYVNTTRNSCLEDIVACITRHEEALGSRFVLTSFISAVHLEYFLNQSPYNIVDYVIARAKLEKLFGKFMNYTREKKILEVKERLTTALTTSGVSMTIATDVSNECRSYFNAFSIILLRIIFA